ncbi:MAG: 3-oxoacyl-[acyl-carrier-protein] reductase [Bacillota bacterium]|jgi:3-oxoacyl-[acyl-carrier protein] reductase
MCLEEKVAIITGASQGIGRAVALELAKNGARVVVNYVDFAGCREQAKEVVSLVSQMGGKALELEADVKDLVQVEMMVQKVVEYFGRIDILVNNAGITRDNLLVRMKENEWDDVIATNLKGTYNCCKSVLKIMMKQKYGKIVNVSSVVGLMGNAGQVNYAASKAGVIGLTKSLAKEVAGRSINVNAVAPGFISTAMTEVLSPNARESLIKHIPLQRLGKPEDVAQLILFLVSDKSSYITGQTIAVDGGMVMN